ncbi:MAG: DUF2442 domain-containing protein [Chloroflexota bacterium]|nr:DUF2442 domain-containing protein [Chloroflexota bacterium]
MLQVKAVQVLGGYWLRLTLSNGDVVDRDVQDLIRGGVFEPLRQTRALFEAAFVDGSTVAWPGEVDIAPETLIWDGSEPDEPAARPKRRLRVHRVTYEPSHPHRVSG